MKEKPIIFSTTMVEGILEGRKTMTRRVIKPQPYDEYGIYYTTIEGFQCGPPGEQIWGETEEGESFQIKPKYEKGDILWVRETWRVSHLCISGNDEWAHIVYKCGKSKTIDVHSTEKSLYYASKAKWQSPLFLPREAARIFLEVKNVGVERIQDISLKDIEHEGFYCDPEYTDPNSLSRHAYAPGMRIHFCKYWDYLNKKRGYSWDSNPWVLVYTFTLKKLDTGGE